MADVVALGGGPAGLASAILLAEQGLEVVVLDRDESPPEDPETAWGCWGKRSVGQFRLVHYLQPGGRALIEEHLPALRCEPPGIEIRYGCPATGLVTGTPVIPGVPHVVGKRTHTGEPLTPAPWWTPPDDAPRCRP